MKRKKQIEEVSSFVNENISRRNFFKKNIDIVSILALGSLFQLGGCIEEEEIIPEEKSCNVIHDCDSPQAYLCWPSGTYTHDGGAGQ